MDTKRNELTELVARRSGKSQPVKRTYILPATDETGEQGWTKSCILNFLSGKRENKQEYHDKSEYGKRYCCVNYK